VADEEVVAGRYKIVETINSGPRGSLHKAFDEHLDKYVALKILILGDQQTLDDLRLETKMLHGLQHPGLPTVRHDFEPGDGSYVIVIDWVDGVDLEHKLQESGKPGLLHSSVVDWVGQVAAALDYLHAQDPPIVHGDVKPSNIVLARNGRVVLLDFGIARQAGQKSNAGTRGFIAPEVAMREPVTHASDVYGLAATTCALLTGQPPSAGRLVLPDIDNSLLAALEQVLEHGLATDPLRRYASAGEFAERLRAGNTALPKGNITLLATEIVEYDERWDREPELMDEIGPRVESLVRIAVDEADGRVAFDTGGDRMLAGFLAASAALRSALAIRARMLTDPWFRDHAVWLRLGLHTGEPDHLKGQYRGASVNKVWRLCRSADPSQILVSTATAPLLLDRMPPGTRLVEVERQASEGSTTLSGPVYSVETGEPPPFPGEPPAAPPPLGPLVPPPVVPPPRRRSSDAMAQLIRERNEVDGALKRKLVQQDEAQRAGQPGLAAKFGDEAGEVSKRLLELQRQIEQRELDERDGSAG
jgi:class 3 adenylate cyclase